MTGVQTCALPILGDAHGRGASGRYSRRDAWLPGQIAPWKVENRCPAARSGAAMRTHEKHIGDAHGRGASGRYSRRDAWLPGQITPWKVENRCPAARSGTAMRTHEKHIGDAHGRGASGRYSCGDTMLSSQVAPRLRLQNADAGARGGMACLRVALLSHTRCYLWGYPS